MVHMTEERTTTSKDADGSTHTTTTIVRDSAQVSGGSGRWVLLIVLLAAVGIGVWFFNGMSGAEIAKDDAIAEAANNVGDAAAEAGEAAGDVAEEVTEDN
jgi:uncharacterized protein HemX